MITSMMHSLAVVHYTLCKPSLTISILYRCHTLSNEGVNFQLTSLFEARSVDNYNMRTKDKLCMEQKMNNLLYNRFVFRQQSSLLYIRPARCQAKILQCKIFSIFNGMTSNGILCDNIVSTVYIIFKTNTIVRLLLSNRAIHQKKVLDKNCNTTCVITTSW